MRVLGQHDVKQLQVAFYFAGAAVDAEGGQPRAVLCGRRQPDLITPITGRTRRAPEWQSSIGLCWFRSRSAAVLWHPSARYRRVP